MHDNNVLSEVIDFDCFKKIQFKEKEEINLEEIKPENDDGYLLWFDAQTGSLSSNVHLISLTDQKKNGPVRVCEFGNKWFGVNNKTNESVACVERKREHYENENSVENYRNGASRIKLGDGKQIQVNNGRTINVLWILIQYALLTWGEVLLSTTALEFSYTQAPAEVKAFSTALWYMTTALANVVVICLKSLEDLTRAYQFLVSSGLVFLAAVIFYVNSRYFNVLDSEEVQYMEREDSECGDEESRSPNRLSAEESIIMNSRTPLQQK